MKQTILTIAFIILNISLSSAVFLKKPEGSHFNIFSEITKLEDEDFGRRLFDTIALQMKNKAPLEDVAKLLADIKSNLETQQAAADKLIAEQRAHCKKEIARFEKNIAHANKEIEESTDLIATYTKEIEQLEAAIENKKKQLEILAARKAKLARDWVADQAAFKKRVAEHSEVIAALEIILPKLRNIPHDHVTTAKTLLVELSKIGHNNPIGALVQLAMSLDPKALQNVVDKLQAIKDSFSASLADDKKAQAKAKDNYHNMMQEIATLKANLENALSDDEAALDTAKANKKFQLQRLSDAQESLKQNTADLKAQRKQCAEWELTYKTETKKRNSEIQVVIQVQQILATKLETMKDYLKTRVNKL